MAKTNFMLSDEIVKEMDTIRRLFHPPSGSRSEIWTSKNICDLNKKGKPNVPEDAYVLT